MKKLEAKTGEYIYLPLGDALRNWKDLENTIENLRKKELDDGLTLGIPTKLYEVYKEFGIIEGLEKKGLVVISINSDEYILYKRIKTRGGEHGER